MIILLSPSKTLNEKIRPQTDKYSQPSFLKESHELVETLRKFTPAQLRELMDINPKLADLNYQRYRDWQLMFTPENSIPAALMFKGEVYNGLKAETMTHDDLDFAQDHLLILSGLYGALRALDLMQPYRLEMGTSLETRKGKDLYEFWGDRITSFINQQLENSGTNYLINLASDEYFGAVKISELQAEVITPQFKDFSGGSYKFLAVYGKKARGMMARFIIQNRVKEIEHLKLFDSEGYFFNENLSQGNKWVFTRG